MHHLECRITLLASITDNTRPYCDALSTKAPHGPDQSICLSVCISLKFHVNNLKRPELRGMHLGGLPRAFLGQVRSMSLYFRI